MTQLVFGTRQIGGAPSFRSCDKKQALELLQYAYEKGIRYFDTAPIYGNGQSEKLVGEALKDIRKDIKIITKFGMVSDSFAFSPDSMKAQLEQSLKNLQTDFIDVYLLHIPDMNMDIHSILTMLNTFKIEGKIGSYGVCNMYNSDLSSFLNHPLSKAEYIQDFYNIIEKKAESFIFPYLKSNHKFMAYSPLYRGLLTQTSMSELLSRDEDALNRMFKNNDLPYLLKQKKLYELSAKKLGISIEELAVQFLQKKKEVDYVLFGTKDKEHLDRFLEVF